jgi:hypothetical protein
LLLLEACEELVFDFGIGGNLGADDDDELLTLPKPPNLWFSISFFAAAFGSGRSSSKNESSSSAFSSEVFKLMFPSS